MDGPVGGPKQRVRDRVITLRVAGWGLLTMSLIVLAAGGILALIVATVAAGTGIYCLVISRERHRSRPGTGVSMVQARLEASLLVGPWAQWWYRRVGATRELERQRRRWRWWVLVVASAAVAINVPYGLASGYGSGFGYSTADLTVVMTLKSVALFVVFTAVLWAARTVAAKRFGPVPTAGRALTRLLGVAAVVAGMVVPTVAGVRASSSWVAPGASRPWLVGVVEALSDTPKVRAGSIRAVSRQELGEDPDAVSFSDEDLDEVLDQVEVIASHDLLILGRNAAGNVVVFDRSTHEPVELHPATFRVLSDTASPKPGMVSVSR